MRSGRAWPAAIVAALLALVIAYVFLLRLAGQPEATVVERDYYRHAVRWDSTLAVRRASDSLGWRLEATLGPLDANGRAALEVRLADRAGAPLAGLDVRAEAIHNLEAGRPRQAALAPTAPGTYAASLPLARAGMWEIRLDARRGAQHFVASVRRDTGWSR